MENPASGKGLQSDRALRELRALIMSGELPAGSHLSETAAAEMLGISRTPTREALVQLVEEGLLDRTSSGRCTVRAFTREDVADAIELRGVIEGTILRIAAERGPHRASLAECRRVADTIEAMLASTEPDVDFEAYTRFNAEFHDHLTRLAASPTLEREAARVYRLPLASPNAFLQSQAHLRQVRRSLFVAQSHHRAMLDAVAAREGARAEALGREHARLARENLEVLTGPETRLADTIPGLSLVKGPGTLSMKGRIS